jgi:hypothetical protein
MLQTFAKATAMALVLTGSEKELKSDIAKEVSKGGSTVKRVEVSGDRFKAYGPSGLFVDGKPTEVVVAEGKVNPETGKVSDVTYPATPMVAH